MSVKKRGPEKKSKFGSTRSIVSARTATIFVITIIIFAVPAAIFLNSYINDLRGKQRLDVEAALITYEATLQAQLGMRWGQLNGLAAFVRANGTKAELDAKFEKFAASLSINEKSIRALEIAPNGVIQYIYPLKGNEQAQNADLVNDKRESVRTDVRAGIATGKTMIGGPYELLQGGRGMVGREPIYDANGNFMYMAQIVFNLDQIFADAGLSGKNLPFEVAVKNNNNDYLHGDNSLFAEKPVTRKIIVYNQTWEMAAIPKDGWDTALWPRVIATGASVGTIIILLSVIISGGLGRQRYLNDMVEQRTHDLAITGQKLRVEVSKERRSREDLALTTRLYTVLSGVNEAVIKSSSKDELFAKACAIVVEKGEFVMSWIGIKEEETGRVVPVAKAGNYKDYLENVNISVLEDAPGGRGPTGTAIRENRIVVSQDIANDPLMKEWRDPALKMGYVASATLPLVNHDQVIGAILIYAGKTDYFVPSVVRLLEETAANISYALDKMDFDDALERAYAQMEQAVRDRTAELSDANEKLMELDRLKSIFIASMSHELRTPLNSIIGFTSIILSDWLGPLNDEQRENLGTVLRSGKHLLALINDVIDISKIEAGTIETQDERFDLYEMAKEAVASFEPEAKGKDLYLTLEGSAAPVNTDKRRANQSLLNLISNALKFTETGGVAVSVFKDDGGVKISVKDTGIGIPENDMEELYLPFSRIDSPLKAKIQGTGLGLYLTKKLVEGPIGGTISQTSVFGKGSVFTITIPAAAKE